MLAQSMFVKPEGRGHVVDRVSDAVALLSRVSRAGHDRHTVASAARTRLPGTITLCGQGCPPCTIESQWPNQENKLKLALATSAYLIRWDVHLCRCGVCQIGVKGQKEAVEHAKATGHQNFSEYH